MTLSKIYSRIFIALLLLLCTPLCFAGGEAAEKTNKLFPVQYKDVEILFLKKDVEKVIFSPVGNGNVHIKNKSFGDLTLTSSTFELLATIANRFSISFKQFSDLPTLLFSKSFSPEKQNIVNQVFQIDGAKMISIQQLDKLSVLLVRKIDKTIEVWVLNPDDNDVYYVIHGVTSQEKANKLISKIHRTY